MCIFAQAPQICVYTISFAAWENDSYVQCIKVQFLTIKNVKYIFASKTILGINSNAVREI